MVKKSPGELYSFGYDQERKRNAYMCAQCTKSFRSQLLVSVHIYNQHSHNNPVKEVKKEQKQFGFYLNGLLPPQTKEAFAKKAVVPVKSAKYSVKKIKIQKVLRKSSRV